MRGLLRCGIWAGPAFTAVCLAEGAVREGYQPLRHPVSSPSRVGIAHNLAAVPVFLGLPAAGAGIITGFGWLTAVSTRALRRTADLARQPR